MISKIVKQDSTRKYHIRYFLHYSYILVYRFLYDDLVEDECLKACIFALKGSNDFDTGQVLENARGNDRDHLFPRSMFASARGVNCVLNMSWMSEETNRKIKRFEKPSEYIPRAKDTDKEPMLNVGEKILWKNVIKRGFWHRHVEWILEITTQGIVMEDGVTGRITRLPYSELYDVVVTNQHSTGTGGICRYNGQGNDKSRI